MELPQQAVNALIQRTTESSSDCESHEPANPNTFYANSLLQQFVAQTQMINATPNTQTLQGDNTSVLLIPIMQETQQTIANDADMVKRKRGRPKKYHRSETSKMVIKNISNTEYTGDPNVSPDSGIQNSPDHRVSSPEISPVRTSAKMKHQPGNKSTEGTKIAGTSKFCEDKRSYGKNSTSVEVVTSKLKEQNKLPITSNRFDRVLYGNTDRVLYPPRRRVGRPPVQKKGPGRPPKYKSTQIVSSQNLPAVKLTNNVKVNDAIGKVTQMSKSAAKTEKIETKPNKSKKVSRNNIRDVQINSHTHTLSLTKCESFKDTSSRKPKISFINEICERVSKRLEQSKLLQKSCKLVEKPDKNNCKGRTLRNRRFSVLTKSKLDKIKCKYATLKHAKLMHSRHKHKKHKKCKFKVLKPLTAAYPDPKINLEIENLVQDFMKLCSISPKSVKEPVQELTKILKKTSKKRKVSEHNERKKKKQNTTNSVNKETNSNEQRLPLKKRHYHLNANNENKQECQVTPIISEVELKSDKKPKENKLPLIISTRNACDKKVIEPLKSPIHTPNKISSSPHIPKVAHINNNEYDFREGAVNTHIDEAIEACITRYASSKDAGKIEIKEEKLETSPVAEEKSVSVGAITTPKKRHLLEIANNSNIETDNVRTNLSNFLKSDEVVKARPTRTIENVVSEIKMKRNLSPKFSDVAQKKLENIAQITKKKNRLEDLTLNLVSKMNPQSIDSDQNQKRKVGKVDDCVTTRASVIKYPICKKTKSVDSDKLDFVVDIKPTGIFTPTVDLELLIPNSMIGNTLPQVKHDDLLTENVKPLEVLKDVTENRTVKENIIELKKVCPNMDVSLKRRTRKRRAINRTGFPTVKKKKKKLVVSENQNVNEAFKGGTRFCDRVPKDGEEYATFVQRTAECAVSLVALEKLQLPQDVIPVNTDLDGVCKWEMLSECDSLPQEDRVEFDNQDVEVKDEKLRRELSPSSVETRISDRIRRQREIKAESRDGLTDDDLTNDSRSEKHMITRKDSCRYVERRSSRFMKRNLYKECGNLFARHLRDVSPASSVETFTEKRLKEERGTASGDDKKNKKTPRWRKKYLIAGLFSDYYKEDE